MTLQPGARIRLLSVWRKGQTGTILKYPTTKTWSVALDGVEGANTWRCGPNEIELE